MRDHYRHQETIFAQTMADRHDWEHTTIDSRRLAIAADAELRRRHPEQRIKPLRSAETAPVNGTYRERLTLTPGQRIGEMPTWVRALAAQRQSFCKKIDRRQELMAMPSRDAILQPPKPQIMPAAQIIQLVQDRDTEPEAAG